MHARGALQLAKSSPEVNLPHEPIGPSDGEYQAFQPDDQPHAASDSPSDLQYQCRALAVYNKDLHSAEAIHPILHRRHEPPAFPILVDASSCS